MSETTAHSDHHFEIVPADRYPAELVTAIDHASSRVALQAMVMTTDETTEPIFAACERALHTHAMMPVAILPDTYSRLFDDNVFAHSLTRGGREARRHVDALRWRLGGLAMRGADTRYVHPLESPPPLRNLNPLAGRNHGKLDVIDDEVMVKGINLSRRYFEAIDYAVRVRHAGAADFGYDYLQELLRYGRIPGDETFRAYRLDDATQLVVNLGRPSKSVIYDTACEVAASAVDLTFVTQYPPKGRLRHVLAERQCYLGKGVVRIFHNRTDQFRQPGATLRAFEMRQPPRLATHGAADGRFIHAKALFATMEDGRTFAMGGSDNLQESLKKMGTAETVLMSWDPALYAMLRRFLLEELTGISGE